MNIINVFLICLCILMILGTVCTTLVVLLYFIKFVWEFITDWKITAKNKKHWK